MYAHKDTLGKIWILSPIILVLGIIFGLEWVYIDQFLLCYIRDYPLLVICSSIPFYIDTILIFANLFVCAIVDPGEVSRTWVLPCDFLVPKQSLADQVQLRPPT